MDILLFTRRSTSITGPQLLIIYSLVGITLGSVITNLIKAKFTKQIRVVLLCAGLILINSIYFFDPKVSLGIAYGYPFGIAITYILDMGSTDKK